MSMSDANYQIAFADLGKMVKLYNLLETDRLGVVTVMEEAAALLKDSEDEINALANLLSTRGSIDGGLLGFKQQVRRNAEAYLTGPVAKGIGFTGANLNLLDVLDALAADMLLVPESINGSAVSAAAPTYPTGNAGTFSLATPTSLSQLLASESWVAECVSIAGGAGAVGTRGRAGALHRVLPIAATAAGCARSRRTRSTASGSNNRTRSAWT